MKNFSTAYAAHIAGARRGETTTLSICWRVVKRDGTLILGTDHDRDITIDDTNIGMDVGSPPFSLEGVYRAGAGILASAMKTSADMSVDNMEVQGALRRPDLFLQDISVDEVRAGLMDGAEITTFRVNWQDPNDFQDILRHGVFGQINWDSDGNYTTEVRGLNQALQQSIGRTAGANCDVEEFGDARCKIDVGPLTATGVVTSVTNRRTFNAGLTPGPAAPSPSNGYYSLGTLRWTSGANNGFEGQVKNDSEGGTQGHIGMWEDFPEDPAPGDTFTLTPGCDRRYTTCRDVHNNLINFRGPGVFCPGPDQILRAS